MSELYQYVLCKYKVVSCILHHRNTFLSSPSNVDHKQNTKSSGNGDGSHYKNIPVCQGKGYRCRAKGTKSYLSGGGFSGGDYIGDDIS